ncbi:RNA polymerase sigma factor [Streptomyces sp. NPDC101455]|uniref:RNA polymerase sigma factor n=1 Tax=Streptomyces sp. NPDC101455 TaxID=3366142 RepID=UPI003816B4A0
MMPGIATERVTAGAWYRGNGPDGRRLERGEMVPLSAEQSERLAVLFERYSVRLVSYARRKLITYGQSPAAAASLAEDIAQDAWIEVSRTGAKDLLRPEELDGEEVCRVLYARVKTQISAHYRRLRSHETPVDWQDPATCNVLCPLLPEGCALAALPQDLDVVVAALPEREREALLLHVDGLSREQAADRMGCAVSTARTLVETALLLLQIGNPNLSDPPVGRESLPGWEQHALEELTETQRAVLLRLDTLPRRVLLLHLVKEMDSRAIADHLGVDRRRICAAYACVPALRALGDRSAQATCGFRRNGADIADALRADLAAMHPGERMPSRQALRVRFGCAGKTALAGLHLLRAEGLLTLTLGHGPNNGFFVADRERLAVAA